LLTPFREDSRARDKRQLRKKKLTPSEASLEPAPLFNQWEYQEILERGVRPLADIEPYQVSSILIDAVAEMIGLGMHQEDLEKASDQDYSEIWCRRLDQPDRDY
jgi:hypothetical protein